MVETVPEQNGDDLIAEGLRTAERPVLENPSRLYRRAAFPTTPIRGVRVIGRGKVKKDDDKAEAASTLGNRPFLHPDRLT